MGRKSKNRRAFKKKCLAENDIQNESHFNSKRRRNENTESELTEVALTIKRVRAGSIDASVGYESTYADKNSATADYIVTEPDNSDTTTDDQVIRVACNDVCANVFTVNKIVEGDNTNVNTRSKPSQERIGKRSLTEEDDTDLKDTLSRHGSWNHYTSKRKKDTRQNLIVEPGLYKRLRTENVKALSKQDITASQSSTTWSNYSHKKVKDSPDKKSQIRNVGSPAEEEDRKDGGRGKTNTKNDKNNQKEINVISRKSVPNLRISTAFDEEKSTVEDKDRKSVTENNGTGIKSDTRCSTFTLSWSSVVVKKRSNAIREVISSDKEKTFGSDNCNNQDSERNINELNSDIDNWECVVGKRKTGSHKKKTELDGTLSSHKKVEQNGSTAERSGYFDVRKSLKINIEGITQGDLITIYFLKYQKWNIQCLKCRADVYDIKIEQKFFQHEEMTIISITQEDQDKDIKLCESFDNSFVKTYNSWFITYWNEILKYVIADKHMIDLHGMTIPVAQAAIEFAVERERQYAKHLRGSGIGTYKKLEIISGRGVHSCGPPVLPGIV